MTDAGCNFAELADVRRGAAELSDVRGAVAVNIGLAVARISAKLDLATALGWSRTGPSTRFDFAAFAKTRAGHVETGRCSSTSWGSGTQASTTGFNFAEMASSRTERPTRFDFAEIANARRGRSQRSDVGGASAADMRLSQIWPHPGGAAQISAKLKLANALGWPRTGPSTRCNFAGLAKRRATRFDFAEIASAPGRSDGARAALADSRLAELWSRPGGVAEISAKLNPAIALGWSRIGLSTRFDFAAFAKARARHVETRRCSSTSRGSGTQASTTGAEIAPPRTERAPRFNFAEIANAPRGTAERWDTSGATVADVGLAEVWPHPGGAADISAELNLAVANGWSRTGRSTRFKLADIDRTAAGRGSSSRRGSGTEASTALLNFAEMRVAIRIRTSVIFINQLRQKIGSYLQEVAS